MAKRKPTVPPPDTGGATRLLLQLTCLLLAYALLVASFRVPYLFAAVIGLGLFLAVRRPKEGWTFGMAREADATDLARADMLGAGGGMLLGKTMEQPRLGEATRQLFTAPDSHSPAVTEAFLSAINRGGGNRGQWVTDRRSLHRLLCLPTGGGKGVSLLIPDLLTNPEVKVILDNKGEAFLAAGAFRERVFKRRQVVLDPWHLVTKEPDRLNPLDALSVEDLRSLDGCLSFAQALVVRTGKEHDSHWPDISESAIWGMTALVVASGEPGERSPQEVADLIAGPQEFQGGLALLKKVRAWDGMAARIGNQLSHLVDRELSSAMSSSNKYLRFLATPAVAASTRSSTFDPAGLRRGEFDVYLIIPADLMRSQSPLLRMWLSTLIGAMMRQGVVRP